MAKRKLKTWHIVGIAAIVVAMLGMFAGVAIYSHGSRVWTDGRTVRVKARDAKLRYVLWTPPEPAGELLNTEKAEYEVYVSPHGAEMYFVRGLPDDGADIFLSRFEDGAWTKPQPLVNINTPNNELGPRLSDDGKTLYFYTNRPGGEGGYDIWKAERADGEFGKPMPLGPSVNSRFDDINPAPTPDGKRLFFATNRKVKEARGDDATWRATVRGDLGNFDIYISNVVFDDQGTANFENTREVEQLNSPMHDGACSVTPTGDFIYFASNREGGEGGLDLYRSRISPDGSLGPVENLGPPVNSPANESDPQVSANGFVLYFSSDIAAEGDEKRSYDLYRSESHEVFADREGRALQGWHWWVLLLAALLLLIPLMRLLSGGEANRKLTMVQRALILSVIAHLLLTIVFSLLNISRDIVRIVQQGDDTGMSVNMAAAKEAEVKLQLRQQVTDLQVAEPSTMERAKRITERAEAVAPAPPTKMDVPQAQIKPSTMQVQARAPKVRRSTPADEVRLPPAQVKADQMRIDFDPIQPVKANESKPQPTDAPQTPSDERMAAQDKPATQIAETRMQATPARPTSESMARKAGREPAARPVIEDAMAYVPVDAMGQPDIDLPDSELRRVRRETQDDSPDAPEKLARTKKQTSASPSGELTDAKAAVPAATPTRESTIVKASTTKRDVESAEMVKIAIADAQPSLDVQLPIAGSLAKVDARTEDTTDRDAPEHERTDRLSKAEAERLDIARQAADDVAPAELNKQSMAEREARNLPDRNQLAMRDLPTPTPLLTDLDRAIGPNELSAPETLFQRDYEQRQKLLRELGGSKESEEAVARALAFLSRTQEPDGRWTKFDDFRGRNSRGKDDHDMALTGLATLCFLAADHPPNKPGQYQQTVQNAVEALVQRQGKDGDLRGKGDMYDHGIATLAVAEAAVMTGDQRLRKAAFKAADFIVKAQNKDGGWRYRPRDNSSDTSVLGWQAMALKSCERLGYEVPDKVKHDAIKWLDRSSRGKHKMLTAYQGNRGPEPAMAAEGTLSRMLLGQALTQAQMKEISEYLLKNPPHKGEHNFYYWYYGSLALQQMHPSNREKAFPKWNSMMRDFLIKLQEKSGREAGSWRPKGKWANRGGRVYSTALSTLTLQVYYRYQAADDQKE